MQIFVLFGGGLFFVATSIVGVRLLFLARRNETQPELILGLAFLVGGTLAGSIGGYVQSAHVDLGNPLLLGRLLLVYCATGVVGMGLYNAFTWRVFRPGEPWAAALVAGILVFGLGLIAWYGTTGVFETGVQPPMQRAVLSAAHAIGPVWATIEGFRYYHLMRKRVALGLGDPVVTNRFLLWGIGGLCASAIVLLGLPGCFVPPSHPIVRAYLVALGFLGTAASVAYALAFFPPESYLARIRAAASLQASGCSTKGPTRAAISPSASRSKP